MIKMKLQKSKLKKYPKFSNRRLVQTHKKYGCLSYLKIKLDNSKTAISSAPDNPRPPKR